MEQEKRYGRTLPRMEHVRAPHYSLDELYTSQDVPQDIRDVDTVVAVINIPGSFNVEDVDVGITLEHSWVRDLAIWLERDSTYLDSIVDHIDMTRIDTIIGPDTTFYRDTVWRDTLINSVATALLIDLFPGDSIVNMTDCWFDDDAGGSIYDGLPPFTGGFRPLRSLDDVFAGHNAQGEWRLYVRDRFAQDEGVLLAFQLEINGILQLTGEVTGSSCRLPLAGVSVVARDSISLDTAGVATTNNRGIFGISRVPSGTYELIFKASGYDSLIVSPVTIITGEQTTVNAELRSTTGVCDVAYPGEPVPIPDLGQASAAVAVTLTEVPLDVDLTLNITHTYVSDLTIWLVHPSNDTIILFNPLAGEDLGQNITNCRFNDEAESSIESALAPFTGDFRPVDSLSTFDGLPAAGIWQLLMEDFVQDDIGTLQGFTLHFEFESVSAGQPGELPSSFMLHPAYPNPFNANVSLNLDVARTQDIQLEVFDITGRLVETLHSGKLNAGSHRFIWAPLAAASGMYFVRVHAADLSQTKKIVLLK